MERGAGRLGGGRAGCCGEDVLFFVWMTRNRKFLIQWNCFSTIFSFAMGEEEGKRSNGRRGRKKERCDCH